MESPVCRKCISESIPHFAGDLVEKAGLRGYRIGGAQISEMHGNFIVNTGELQRKMYCL